MNHEVSWRPGLRRRVVQISEADQQLLERGEKPSWAEPSTLSARDPGSDGGALETGNDRRLQEEVPPHWVLPPT